MDRATYVLAFDVTHPRRLRRLSRFLEGQAHRVQKSVFEAVLGEVELRGLLERAVHPDRFDPSLDSLRVYRVCAACLRATQLRGQGPTPLSLTGPLVF
jgi:CRISPR-associated endonuclease Cas2